MTYLIYTQNFIEITANLLHKIEQFHMIGIPGDNRTAKDN